MTLTTPPSSLQPEPTRTRPPVTVTVPTRVSADRCLKRVAHNALSVALLSSSNAPVMRVHTQAPNNTSRVHTVGGGEVQAADRVRARLAEGEARLESARPGTADHDRLCRSVARMDSHLAQLEAEIDDLDATPRRPAGMRDAYRVTVPALHARVGGVEYVSNLVTMTVWADPTTPDYARYLGRGEHAGKSYDEGLWPLYVRQGGGVGMRRADTADRWEVALMEALWGLTPLPRLRLSMVITPEPEEEAS